MGGMILTGVKIEVIGEKSVLLPVYWQMPRGLEWNLVRGQATNRLSHSTICIHWKFI